MRGTRDALRSVKRYLDLVLNEGPPPLGEIWWGPDPAGAETYRWTHRGVSPGCLEVDEAAWTWLKRSSRGPEEVVVGQAARRWARSRLVYDPTPDLIAVGLPTAGTPVDAPGSLEPGDETWEVALHAERGTFEFPLCRVTLLPGGGTSGPARFYDVTQPMAIECYPRVPDDAELAIDAALQVQDALLDAFRGRGVDDGRPRLIPLFDYDGVPLAEGVADTRLPNDFLRVLDFSPRLLPDPQDPRQVRIVADLRVGWRKALPAERMPTHPSSEEPSPTVKGQRIVTEVRAEWDVE